MTNFCCWKCSVICRIAELIRVIAMQNIGIGLYSFHIIVYFHEAQQSSHILFPTLLHLPPGGLLRPPGQLGLDGGGRDAPDGRGRVPHGKTPARPTL